LPGRRSLDLRRVLDVGADLAKNVAHDGDEGEIERRVAEDEACPSVDQAQIDKQDVERDKHDRGRQNALRQEPQSDVV